MSQLKQEAGGVNSVRTELIKTRLLAFSLQNQSLPPQLVFGFLGFWGSYWVSGRDPGPFGPDCGKWLKALREAKVWVVVFLPETRMWLDSIVFKFSPWFVSSGDSSEANAQTGRETLCLIWTLSVSLIYCFPSPPMFFFHLSPFFSVLNFSVQTNKLSVLVSHLSLSLSLSLLVFPSFSSLPAPSDRQA